MSFLSTTLFAAEPWFTGPFLANAGQTIPKNHLNIEPYFFYFVNEGEFIRNPVTSTSLAQISDVVAPVLTLGVTDDIDAQVLTTFNHNVQAGQRFNGIGDTNLLLGYQVMRQEENSRYKPNLRVTVQETIPTGRYTELNPIANGTDATGLGSYQTNVGLNFSYLSEPFTGHYLQSTLNLNYLHAQPVALRNFNTFGGDENTNGHIDPGNLMSLDLAFEFSITQNWVAVIETFMSHRQATRFEDHTNSSELLFEEIGNGPVTEFTLAPALEYNYSSTLGLIAGAWFSLGGKNAPSFYSPALAINYLF